MLPSSSAGKMGNSNLKEMIPVGLKVAGTCDKTGKNEIQFTYAKNLQEEWFIFFAVASLQML